MNIIIVNGSGIPIYEQVVNAIKENILNGELKNGEQLPSVRELAKELSISILTVKKAYDELEKQGLIKIRQGLGSFVDSDTEELVIEEKQKELEEKILEAIKLSISIGISKDDLKELWEFIYGEVLKDE